EAIAAVVARAAAANQIALPYMVCSLQSMTRSTLGPGRARRVGGIPTPLKGCASPSRTAGEVPSRQGRSARDAHTPPDGSPPGGAHANVQPHAGAQTNMAVYMAALQPGETILSLELSHGGHLTHGLKVNFSGRLYTIVHYGVSRETNVVDYDDVLKLAKEHKPK